eukprot:8601977-Pyramimonas_sp.AAC.1
MLHRRRRNQTIKRSVFPCRGAKHLRGQCSALLQRLGYLRAPVASVRRRQGRAGPLASPLPSCTS